MNLNSKLGAFATTVLMSACGGGGDNADAPVDLGEGGTSSAVGGSFSTGAVAGAKNGGSKNGGVSAGGGSKNAGESPAAGSPGNGENAGGSGSADEGGDDDGEGADGDTDGEGDGVGAGGSRGDDDPGVHAGGSNDEGEGGSAPHEGGRPGSAGSGGRASGGSGPVEGGGGSGSVASNGGSGPVEGGGGSGGLAENGGSGPVEGGGGSGGISNDAGVGGRPPSGGSGGVSGSGGTAGSAGAAGAPPSLDPEFLFTEEIFGGNGRTCVTCHTLETGTISPEQIQTLYSAAPTDPMFRPIDSDDGQSDDYSQLLARATFRVTIDLPPGVTLTSDPNARSIVLRRGVPTTINSPALDPVIMWDGREPSLTAQALSAILGHAEGTVIPTQAQLELIAEFEQGPDFFSSELLQQYSQGGSAPTWPPGITAEEQRGRRWFAQESAAPRFNICGQCHGGPMTNETQANSGLPVGRHFQTANVSEFNTLGNPVYEFRFPDPNNPSRTRTVRTPDPGRALVTGNFRDVNFFKIPTLWGVQHTAPYFHDNSANTLEELMDHYERHLATFLRRGPSYPTPHVPTAEDKADIIAYLKLL